MKKIWICGSQGMLGSHFTSLMAERSIPFVESDRDTLDITDLNQVSDYVRIQKISHVINCAAYTQVDLAETEQKQAYMVNAMGAHHLAVAARRHGARLIHFSTDYVFDGSERIPYKEDHPCRPLNAYGMSKFAGELKILEEHRHTCILRTSWLFGGPHPNFVLKMLSLMQEREQIKVVSDQVGRPTYCADLAAATLELLALDAEGIFHFANAYETSWYLFAKEIKRQAEELGFPLKCSSIDPIPTSQYPTPAVRPVYSTLNTRKIEALLKQTPRSWQEALKAYLKALKKTPHLEPAAV